MATYTKAQIATLLRKESRTIQYYVDFGLVEPGERKRGVAMKFTKEDLITFGMADVLASYGHSLSFVKDVLNELKTGMAQTWDGKRGLISLTDFYTSKEWGSKKELFLIGNGEEYQLHVFPIKKTTDPTKKYGSFKAINEVISMLVGPKNITSLTLVIMSRVKEKALALVSLK